MWLVHDITSDRFRVSEINLFFRVDSETGLDISSLLIFPELQGRVPSLFFASLPVIYHIVVHFIPSGGYRVPLVCT